ncbi:MAG: hypothetical protein LBT69_05535 [Lactobacillales bacterium]|jgi:hypothetical protein|nr:hypothetical protein [Lactobacillales bacterium]
MKKVSETKMRAIAGGEKYHCFCGFKTNSFWTLIGHRAAAHPGWSSLT